MFLGNLLYIKAFTFFCSIFANISRSIFLITVYFFLRLRAQRYNQCLKDALGRLTVLENLECSDIIEALTQLGMSQFLGIQQFIRKNSNFFA